MIYGTNMENMLRTIYTFSQSLCHVSIQYIKYEHTKILIEYLI